MPAPRTCDCGSCVTCHKRERSRRVRVAKAQGRWEPRGDLEAVVEHLRWLRSRRVSITAIHRATGIAEATIKRIHDGHNQWITRHVADAILKVSPSDGIQHLAVGTRRRLRALGRIGHSTYAIADELGVGQSVISGLMNSQVYVGAAQATRIAELYDRWSMTPGSSAQSIRLATAKGWPSPLAWDDETIDDPTAAPAGLNDDRADAADPVVVERILAGDFKVTANRAERRAVISEWLTGGGSANELIRRTGWPVHRLMREMRDFEAGAA